MKTQQSKVRIAPRMPSAHRDCTATAVANSPRLRKLTLTATAATATTTTNHHYHHSLRHDELQARVDLASQLKPIPACKPASREILPGDSPGSLRGRSTEILPCSALVPGRGLFNHVFELLRADRRAEIPSRKSVELINRCLLRADRRAQNKSPLAS